MSIYDYNPDSGEPRSYRAFENPTGSFSTDAQAARRKVMPAQTEQPTVSRDNPDTGQTYRELLDYQISHCPVCKQKANPFTHVCSGS
jgi:hypothetical protein